MFAPYPNRYQLEQIRKLKAEGLSVEEISRQIQVEENGVQAHFDDIEDLPEEDPEQGTEEE